MGETVLIVDDDSDVREVASAAPTRCGYSAVDTGDPQRALGIVREQPDLLLTDVIMPLMKGTELADRVQAVSPPHQSPPDVRVPNGGHRAVWPRVHGKAV